MPPRESPPPRAGDAGPGPDRPGLSPGLVALAIACVVFAIGVMTLFKMSNNDIWIHLKTGEYVLKNGWVPIKDPYSFIAADHDYVAHEWLAGVVFYLVYAPFGVVGLIFEKAAIIGAACWLLISSARLLRARWSVILPALMLMLYISSARYLERPHIFSYLMAAAYLWLFLKYREGGRRRLWLYLIPAAHVLWTNLHGGYVQGLAMVVTFALGETLIWARAKHLGAGKEKALPAEDVVRVALLIPACFVATLINPYGWRLLTFPFELTGLKLFMNSIYEWQPPFHPSYNASTMFVLYFLQVGLLWVTFFFAQRDRRREEWGLRLANYVFLGAFGLICFDILVYVHRILQFGKQPPLVFGFPGLALHLYLIAVVLALFTLVNFRSVDFTLAGIFALFFLLSLRHNRAVTDAAMGTFVLLAASASAVLDGARRREKVPPPRKGAKGAEAPPAAPQAAAFVDRSSPAAIVLGCSLLLTVSAHALVFTYYYDFNGSGREKGFEIADNMPTCAVDFIERNHITGNAFVSYAYAAMLIHRMYPAVKVNMDSRNDVYGEQLYLEFLGALRSPDGMKEYLSRHPIDFFLMAYGDRLPAVFDALEATHEWAPVYYDDRSFILLRVTPENEEILRSETFRTIRPAVMGGNPTDESNAAQVFDEADRSIRNCPKALFGYYYKSKSLIYLRRYDEAIEVSREILSRNPGTPLPYADMGMAYAGLNQRDRAIEMYQRALDIDPTFDLAKENLRRLRGF